MNLSLRLAAGEVRVRIGLAEAEALARGEAIGAEVRAPGGALAWRVVPAGDAPALALEGGAVVVSVPAAEVRRLLDAPPSKDLGIRASVGDTALVLEIDLWSGKKR